MESVAEKKSFHVGNRKETFKRKSVKTSGVHDNLPTSSKNLRFQGYALHILTSLRGIITLPPVYDKEHNQIVDNMR
jgi:hypothetical protein